MQQLPGVFAKDYEVESRGITAPAGTHVLDDEIGCRTFYKPIGPMIATAGKLKSHNRIVGMIEVVCDLILSAPGMRKGGNGNSVAPYFPEIVVVTGRIFTADIENSRHVPPFVGPLPKLHGAVRFDGVFGSRVRDDTDTDSSGSVCLDADACAGGVGTHAEQRTVIVDG